MGLVLYGNPCGYLIATNVSCFSQARGVGESVVYLLFSLARGDPEAQQSSVQLLSKWSVTSVTGCHV